MQRFAITSLAIASVATPAFAHSGAHVHPHASDPVWLPLVVGSIVIAILGLLVWTQK